MKMRTVVLMLAAFLLCCTPALADQIGLGGAYVDGHSDSGKYGINNKGDQSWGVHFNYDKDMGWKKVYDNHVGFGVDPSLQLFYLHWTKTINKKEKYKKEWCRGDDCYYPPIEQPTEAVVCLECEDRYGTKTTYSTQNVDSLIGAVGPKVWFGIGKFQIYGLAGIGYALQDGAQDDGAAVLQAGASFQFTKNFGLSLDHSEVYVNPTGKYDRFDVTSLNAVLFF